LLIADFYSLCRCIFSRHFTVDVHKLLKGSESDLRIKFWEVCVRNINDILFSFARSIALLLVVSDDCAVRLALVGLSKPWYDLRNIPQTTQNNLLSFTLTWRLVFLQWQYSCHSFLGIRRMAGQIFTRAYIHIPGDQKTLSEEAIFSNCFTPFFAIILIAFCTVVSVSFRTSYTEKWHCRRLYLNWQRASQFSDYWK
jgi:hypothetical protein